jgi:hypothetical protein
MSHTMLERDASVCARGRWHGGLASSYCALTVNSECSARAAVVAACGFRLIAGTPYASLRNADCAERRNPSRAVGIFIHQLPSPAHGVTKTRSVSDGCCRTQYLLAQAA